MIKSVAKISEELADEIRGTIPEGESNEFNPVPDADGNTIINLWHAQFLEPSQFEVIAHNPPNISLLPEDEEQGN